MKRVLPAGAQLLYRDLEDYTLNPRLGFCRASTLGEGRVELRVVWFVAG